MPLSGKALDYLKDQLELHIRRFDASTIRCDTNFAAPTKVAKNHKYLSTKHRNWSHDFGSMEFSQKIL